MLRRKKTKHLIYLCLISGLILFEACSKEQKQITDKDIFLWYVEQIGFTLPEGEHSVIIVPSSSCSGCRKAAVNYGNVYRDSVSVIVSGNIASEFEGKKMIVDSASLCNDLNWKHSNVIEVKISNSEVKTIRSYDAAESIERFSVKDISDFENCTDGKCKISK